MMFFWLVPAIIFFVVFAYWRPLWALYLITALLPSYLIRFKVGLIPFTFLEAMILLLALILLISRQFDWQKIKNDAFFWPIITLLIVASISVFVSSEPIKGAGIWKAYFIEPVIFYWLMLSLIKKRKQLEGVFWALGLSVIYLFLVSLFQKFFGWGVPETFLTATGAVDRTVSLFGYPNAFGLYVGPLVVLFIGFWFYDNPDPWLHKLSVRWRFFFKMLVILFGLAGLFLAKSEGAILAVLACVFLMFLFNHRARRLALAGFLIGLFYFLFDPVLRDWVLEKVTLQDWSGFVRRTMWGETWLMLKDNWFWGVGLAGYKTAIIPYHTNTWFETFPYPHNILFNFWSELGLMGVLVFVWLSIRFVWVNLKNIFCITYQYSMKLPFDKIASFVFLFVALEMLIHGLVDAPYFKNDLAVLVWILIGSGVLNWQLKEKYEDEC